MLKNPLRNSIYNSLTTLNYQLSIGFCIFVNTRILTFNCSLLIIILKRNIFLLWPCFRTPAWCIVFSLSLFGNSDYIFLSKVSLKWNLYFDISTIFRSSSIAVKSNGKRQVESNTDLLQASATETLDTVKEPFSWLDQANYMSVLPEW